MKLKKQATIGGKIFAINILISDKGKVHRIRIELLLIYENTNTQWKKGKMTRRDTLQKRLNFKNMLNEER